MRIGQSTSLSVAHQLRLTQQGIARALQRLSSGQRVNSPQDDVASFSQLVGLSSKIRGLRQANLNINQAKGLLSTGESAMNAQADILQRMRELAVQASSSSLSMDDRSQLDAELVDLLDQFEKITYSTSFNGIQLLDASVNELAIQVGTERHSQLSVSLANTTASNLFKKNIGFGSVEETQVDDGGFGFLFGSAAHGDFDNDGVVDLLQGKEYGGGAVLYRGLGNGQFSSGEWVDASTAMSEFAVGDFDQDGNLDFAATSGFSGGSFINIYLGNGDGSFQSVVTMTAGSGNEGIETGDLNNDGILDLVVSSYNDTAVSIYLGLGDGSFADRATHTMGRSRGLALADYNGDGALDLLAANPVDNTLSYALGNNDGTFGSRSTIATGTLPQRVSLADLDGDGDLDAAVTAATSDHVRIFENTGAGFVTSNTYSVGDAPRDIRFIDYDRDGDQDFITNTTAGIVLYVNNGQGTFSFAKTIANSSSDSDNFILLDVDGDGFEDIVDTDINGAGIRVFRSVPEEVKARYDLRLASKEQSELVLEILDAAIDKLSLERSRLGSAHNQLEQLASYNLLQAANLEEASDNLKSADLSLEIAELVRLQILEQAQITALSQANVQVQAVLSLLDSL